MRSRAGRKEERETREAGEVKKLGEGDSCGEEEGGRERIKMHEDKPGSNRAQNFK